MAQEPTDNGNDTRTELDQETAGETRSEPEEHTAGATPDESGSEPAGVAPDEPEPADAGRAEPEPGAGAPPEAGATLPSVWRQNFVTRAMVAVPLLLVVLLLVAVAPARLLALVVAAAGVYGAFEYARLVTRGVGAHLPMGPMLFAAAAIGLGGLIGTATTLNAGLLVGTVLLVWAVWFTGPAGGGEGLRDGGVALAGLLLVPWLLNHLGLLLQLPGGSGFLAFLIVAVTLNDTLAYLVGTFLGNWPLLPAVSPNKTVEGAVGGVVGGALGGLIATLWIAGGSPAFSWLGLVLLGALLAVAGQAGDLLESKLKRLTNAEESGSFLPGHGGLLDRVDAYLLASPLAYYLFAGLAG